MTIEQIREATRIIERAEKALGELTVGQMTDLLLDNMQDLGHSTEARAVVEAVMHQRDAEGRHEREKG